MKAQFKIIMRRGYFIPQERFLRFFWKDLSSLPIPYKKDDPNRTVMYSLDQAEDFIRATLDHRRQKAINKSIEKCDINFYYDSEGRGIGNV